MKRITIGDGLVDDRFPDNDSHNLYFNLQIVPTFINIVSPDYTLAGDKRQL